MGPMHILTHILTHIHIHIHIHTMQWIKGKLCEDVAGKRTSFWHHMQRTDVHAPIHLLAHTHTSPRWF